jgi:hypothetical protein
MVNVIGTVRCARCTVVSKQFVQDEFSIQEHLPSERKKLRVEERQHHRCQKWVLPWGVTIEKAELWVGDRIDKIITKKSKRAMQFCNDC